MTAWHILRFVTLCQFLNVYLRSYHLNSCSSIKSYSVTSCLQHWLPMIAASISKSLMHNSTILWTVYYHCSMPPLNIKGFNQLNFSVWTEATPNNICRKSRIYNLGFETSSNAHIYSNPHVEPNYFPRSCLPGSLAITLTRFYSGGHDYCQHYSEGQVI